MNQRGGEHLDLSTTRWGLTYDQHGEYRSMAPWFSQLQELMSQDLTARIARSRPLGGSGRAAIWWPSDPGGKVNQTPRNEPGHHSVKSTVGVVTVCFTTPGSAVLDNLTVKHDVNIFIKDISIMLSGSFSVFTGGGGGGWYVWGPFIHYNGSLYVHVRFHRDLCSRIHHCNRLLSWRTRLPHGVASNCLVAPDLFGRTHQIICIHFTIRQVFAEPTYSLRAIWTPEIPSLIKHNAVLWSMLTVALMTDHTILKFDLKRHDLEKKDNTIVTIIK